MKTSSAWTGRRCGPRTSPASWRWTTCPDVHSQALLLEPQKVGDKANALLCEPLKKASKIGIAKVVSKRRQYLAAVKPQDQLHVLELMHFADELIDTGQFKVAERDVDKKDRQKAGALIDNMSDEGNPEKYRDEYGEALGQVIDEKIEHPEKDLPKKAAPKTFTESHRPRGGPPEEPVESRRAQGCRETRAPQEGGIEPA